MSNDARNSPIHSMRLGPIKCSIWSNEGADGRPYFSTLIVRSYRLPPEKREANDDGWRESNSMNEDSLVLQQELCRRAVTWIESHQADKPDVEF